MQTTVQKGQRVKVVDQGVGVVKQVGVKCAKTGRAAVKVVMEVGGMTVTAREVMVYAA